MDPVDDPIVLNSSIPVIPTPGSSSGNKSTVSLPKPGNGAQSSLIPQDNSTNATKPALPKVAVNNLPVAENLTVEANTT